MRSVEVGVVVATVDPFTTAGVAVVVPFAWLSVETADAALVPELIVCDAGEGFTTGKFEVRGGFVTTP